MILITSIQYLEQNSRDCEQSQPRIVVVIWMGVRECAEMATCWYLVVRVRDSLTCFIQSALWQSISHCNTGARGEGLERKGPDNQFRQ